MVEIGPGFDNFQKKQAFTANRLPNTGKQFRVVSYNLLADFYSDSDFSRTELFPYCPVNVLAIDYRKQVFVREILGYHADIVCLQEVDAKIFDNDLQLFLGDDGFEGTYQRKGDTLEGLATFYNLEKFRLVFFSGKYPVHILIRDNFYNSDRFSVFWRVSLWWQMSFLWRYS